MPLSNLPISRLQQRFAVGGSHQSPLALEWALAPSSSWRTRPMAHQTAQSFRARPAHVAVPENSTREDPSKG